MRAPPLKESEVQGQVCDGLEALGYQVWSTVVRGWRGSRGYGADKGVPDLLVGHPSWGVARLAVEVKGPATKLSPEQTALFESGMLIVARSFEDAVVGIAVWERANGLSGPACRYVAPRVGRG